MAVIGGTYVGAAPGGISSESILNSYLMGQQTGQNERKDLYTAIQGQWAGFENNLRGMLANGKDGADAIAGRYYAGLQLLNRSTGNHMSEADMRTLTDQWMQQARGQLTQGTFGGNQGAPTPATGGSSGGGGQASGAVGSVPASPAPAGAQGQPFFQQYPGWVGAGARNPGEVIPGKPLAGNAGIERPAAPAASAGPAQPAAAPQASGQAAPPGASVTAPATGKNYKAYVTSVDAQGITHITRFSSVRDAQVAARERKGKVTVGAPPATFAGGAIWDDSPLGGRIIGTPQNPQQTLIGADQLILNTPQALQNPAQAVAMAAQQPPNASTPPASYAPGMAAVGPSAGQASTPQYSPQAAQPSQIEQAAPVQMSLEEAAKTSATKTVADAKPQVTAKILAQGTKIGDKALASGQAVIDSISKAAAASGVQTEGLAARSSAIIEARKNQAALSKSTNDITRAASVITTLPAYKSFLAETKTDFDTWFKNATPEQLAAGGMKDVAELRLRGQELKQAQQQAKDELRYRYAALALQERAMTGDASAQTIVTYADFATKTIEALKPQIEALTKAGKTEAEIEGALPAYRSAQIMLQKAAGVTLPVASLFKPGWKIFGGGYSMQPVGAAETALMPNPFDTAYASRTSASSKSSNITSTPGLLQQQQQQQSQPQQPQVPTNPSAYLKSVMGQ